MRCRAAPTRLGPTVCLIVVHDALRTRCRVCPFMLRALHYALAKAQALQPGWLALRVSYGMNGVLLRVRKTLNPQLSLHLSAAPPPLHRWRILQRPGARRCPPSVQLCTHHCWQQGYPALSTLFLDPHLQPGPDKSGFPACNPLHMAL